MLFGPSSLFIEDQAWITWFSFSCSRRIATTHHTVGCLQCFGSVTEYFPPAFHITDKNSKWIQPTASQKKIPFLVFICAAARNSPQDFKRLVGAAACEQHQNYCYVMRDTGCFCLLCANCEILSFAFFCIFVYLNFFVIHTTNTWEYCSRTWEIKLLKILQKHILQEIKFLFLLEN